MLRDLTGEERAVYFRGIQPIWGGGLAQERFQLFQRRLADAPEAKDRYRLLGWFVQGLSEFSLYVPALAWMAFTLAGAVLGSVANEIDKVNERR